MPKIQSYGIIGQNRKYLDPSTAFNVFLEPESPCQCESRGLAGLAVNLQKEQINEIC